MHLNIPALTRYMITEYCQGGELFFHLKRMRRFKEGMMRFYIGEVRRSPPHLPLTPDLDPER